MSDSARLDHLDRRCALLERALHDTHRSLRTTRRWGAALGVAAAVTILVAATTDVTRFDTIRAHRLEVIDAAGQVVLAAAADDHGGRIDTWSPSGDNLLRLSASAHGGDLAIWSAAGHNVAGAWATPEGGHLAVWNAQGDRGAHVAAGPDGGIVEVGLDANDPQVAMSAGESPAFNVGRHVRITDDPRGARLTLASSAEASLTLATHPGAAGVTATTPTGTAAIQSGIDGPAITLEDGDDTVLALDVATGPRLIADDSTLRLARGTLSCATAQTTWLTAGISDGSTALTLSAPESVTSLRAGPDAGLNAQGDTATIHLAGHLTEDVHLASDATAPILATADDGLALYADEGAGKIIVGSGEGGRVRLTGPVDGMRPAVEILAPSGTRLATMTTTGADAGLMAVADDTGTPLGLLHAMPDGHARLRIIGPDGQAVAGTASDGSPEFALMAPGGRTLAALAAVSSGGALNLMNADGTPVVLAGITSNGPGGAAAFQNGQGTTVVAAGATADGDGDIVVRTASPPDKNTPPDDPAPGN